MPSANLKFLATVTCGVILLGSLSTNVWLLTQRSTEVVVQPAEQLAAKPTEQSAAKPTEQPAAKPAGKAAVKPAEKSAAKPAAQVAAKPAGQPGRVADAATRARTVKNLKQIMLAMLSYHDAYQRYPTDILDKNGKPLLSWRVVILPYIGQNDLYKQFKIDEPWDSEHNKKLGQTVVKVFQNGTEPQDAKFLMTHYQRPTGKGTAHEQGKKLWMIDMKDGTFNTIFVVETKQPVEWTKPTDLPYDLNFLPEVRGPFDNVFHCVMGTADVHSIPGGLALIPAKTLISRDGQEMFDNSVYLGTGWKDANPDDPETITFQLLTDFSKTAALLRRAHEDIISIQLQLNEIDIEAQKPHAGDLGLTEQLQELQTQLQRTTEHRAKLQSMLDEELKKQKKQ